MTSVNYTVAVMIYNVEKYLPACVESIVSQQGDDIEILLIDDGATDSCGRICDAFAEKDGRIRVIHQKNAGVAAARNTALDNARGKWLIQVDGDDLLVPGAIDGCRPYLGDDSAWLQLDAVPFADGSPLPAWTPKSEPLVVTGDALHDLHVGLIDHAATDTVFPTYNMNPAWSKAWNMEFLRKNGLHYDPKVVKGEGTLFTFTCSYYAQKVTFVPSLLYGYRLNPTSIMHRFSGSILDGQNVQMETYRKIVMEHGEGEDELIRSCLNKRSLYLIENAIALGISHPDCDFGKEEKAAFLTRLCELPWVREAAEGTLLRNGSAEPYLSIRNRDIARLEKFCARLRTKMKLSRAVRGTGIGRAALKLLHKG